jgi:Mrp family chromosome partitioning ATPase
MAPPVSSHPQVALLDIDICGPSIPKIMGLEGEQVIADWESDPFFSGQACTVAPLSPFSMAVDLGVWD